MHRTEPQTKCHVLARLKHFGCCIVPWFGAAPFVLGVGFAQHLPCVMAFECLALIIQRRRRWSVQETPCFKLRRVAIWCNDHRRSSTEETGDLQIFCIKTNLWVDKNTLLLSLDGIASGEDGVKLDRKAEGSKFYSPCLV
jgi:hypothetical protein